jgi:hypothetical protein
MKWIPKKYMQHIKEVYKDADGWWAITKKGYRFAEMECHTAHEDTQHELLKVIRTMEPCECSECTEPEIVEETVVEETVVEETVVEQDQEMDAELVDFKRYTDLLAIVYDTKTTASAEDEQELDALSYKLKLNGVPDAVSEMNFERLQNKMERYSEPVPALEIRIRDIKTNEIGAWYCQMFNSHQEYEKEVDRQFDLKEYFKKETIFEIEHVDLVHVRKLAETTINVMWYDYAEKESFTKDVTLGELKWLQEQPHIQVDGIQMSPEIFELLNSAGFEKEVREIKVELMKEQFERETEMMVKAGNLILKIKEKMKEKEVN